MRLFTCLFLLSILFSLNGFGQVGINTTNPQQALHVAGTTSTIRIEGLDHTNNSYNGGDADLDGDLTNNTYPLYVDSAGDFSLELETIIGSEETDAFDDASLPTSSVILLATSSTGENTTDIVTYSITTSRASILEVKYGISYDIYLDNSYTIITDDEARRVETSIIVSGDAREYGPAAKSYSSGSANSAAGPYYNSCTTYISLPSAGTFDVTLKGLVSSNIKSAGGGTTSRATYVEFATHNDFIFMRLY